MVLVLLINMSYGIATYVVIRKKRYVGLHGVLNHNKDNHQALLIFFFCDYCLRHFVYNSLGKVNQYHPRCNEGLMYTVIHTVICTCRFMIKILQHYYNVILHFVFHVLHVT